MTETILNAAFGHYGLTDPVADGRVTIDGARINHIDVKPVIAIFRKMCRELSYDVCELALTTYMTAKSHGKPFTAIPVFPFRQFHHRRIVVRKDSAIRSPKDLEGRKVGLRAYTVTTGVWQRGILAEEYGVDLDKVRWISADEEHVREYQLPSNVEQRVGADLGKLLADGEIDAAIGVAENPDLGFVSLIDAEEAARAEAAWYSRTGIYPINHTIVIRDELIAQDPTLPTKLCTAFREARAIHLAEMADLLPPPSDVAEMRAACGLVGDEFLALGIAANRPTLEALIRMAHAQKILPRRYSPEELFAVEA